MRAILTFALLLPVIQACEPVPSPIDTEAPVIEATPNEPLEAPQGAGALVHLLLETRTGMSELGWSFGLDAAVPADQADVVLTSFDCGTRGRWVTLAGVGDTEICVSTDDGGLDCQVEVAIGGSDFTVDLGDTLTIRGPHGEHRVELIDRTETPFDWLDQDDLSFFVDLELREQRCRGAGVLTSS